MARFNDDNATEMNARGRARMVQLANEMRSEVAGVAGIMIASLGRPATALETLQAEAISALFLKARRLRDQGKDDIEYLREACHLTSNSVFRHPLDTSPRHHALDAEPGHFRVSGGAVDFRTNGTE